jgi:hypothetical protein
MGPILRLVTYVTNLRVGLWDGLVGHQISTDDGRAVRNDISKLIF